MATVNNDFETDFEPDDKHVQYGTYEKQPAALLFNMHFAFRNESIKRIKEVIIELAFEETLTSGKDLIEPEPWNPNNDPVIKVTASAQVCSEVKTEDNTKKWHFGFTPTIPIAGIDLGPDAGTESEKTFSRDHRTRLMGWSTSDDDDHHSDNIAKWRMRENTQQSSGVLHQFTAAALITLPPSPENDVKVTVLVRSYVAFSLNPLRLRQKRDDPIYLDRHTPKGDAIAPGLDFKDPTFP